MKILVIEDDPDIVETLSLVLGIRWPEAKLISTPLGRKGVEIIQEEPMDLVILDLGLPDISGFEVLKKIRLISNVPLIVLTARPEEADIVKALEWGADDYIIKPFRQLELLARLKAAVRRQPRRKDPTLDIAGFLQFDSNTRQLTTRTKSATLTANEAQIMARLIRSAGYVVTHAELAEAVWGTDYPDAADSLKVYIRRLREKIEEEPEKPSLIIAKPGIGYMLNKPE